MKPLIIALVLGTLAGGIAGFTAGVFVYPFWFLNDIATNSLTTNADRTPLAVGEFVPVNSSGQVHWGKTFGVLILSASLMK